jgi:two-component system, LytTR family, response regulator LytT
MQYQIKILIVEDDVLIAQDLQEMLEDWGYSNIFKARNYNRAIEILANEKIDLTLLDINLGEDQTGVDLGSYIHQHHQIPFIYITSYSDADTLAGVKQTFPAGFLLKPYDAKLLQATIEIAFFNYSSKRQATTNLADNEAIENEFIINDTLLIKDNYLYVKIPLKEIFWFESDKNYVEVKTAQRKYVIRTTLKKLLEALPQNQFVRCHKQYVVNIAHVQKFGANALIINNVEVPISRTEKEEVLRLLKS